MATVKCTYIFAAINRNMQKSKPIMLRVQATDENSARSLLSSEYKLYFAGRLSFLEVAHG